MQRERFAWLYWQKARYPLFAALGLFLAYQLTTHDSGLWFAIEAGETDSNSVKDLYLTSLNHEQVITLGRAFFAGMLGLIGYAISIRLAQRHYEKHGISLPD